MNKLFLFSALLVFACASLHAQVTIGALEKPHAGAVLDLNSSVKGGLTLSNVALTDRHVIPSTFPGMTPAPDDLDMVKANFAGALVYHTGGNNIPSGVYVWNGTIWLSIEENCTRLDANKLNVATSFGIVDLNAPVTFTVSSGASPACADGEEYEWFIDGISSNTTTNYLSSPFTTNTLLGGPHRIGVKASNLYDYSQSSQQVSSNEVIVYVRDSGTPTPYDDVEDDDDYVLNGNICYDVKGPRNESTESQVNYDLRVNAFAKSFEKTFRFDYTGPLTSLSVLAPDPGSIIASVTQPARTFGPGNSVSFTATFVEGIRDLVVTQGTQRATLWVGYITSDSPTAIKFASLEIRVQDADCHCPVRASTNISSTGWLTFMCRDLGATKNIRSLEDMNNVTQDDYLDYHGDWYKFGAASASLVNNAQNATLYGDNAVSDWASRPGGTWATGGNNPCPDGWRVPSITEWEDVLTKNTQTFYQGTTVINETIWGNVNSNTTTFSEKFNRMVRIGDLFFFPAGTRGDSDGKLDNLFNFATYWSSTRSLAGGSECGAVYVHSTETKVKDKTEYTSPQNGYTVRCVAQGEN